MAELRLRPAIIPTRILLMLIHLLLTIIAFVDRVYSFIILLLCLNNCL